MATLGTSWIQTHPSRVEPGVLMQINQHSQALRTVAGGAPRIILDPEDLYIYMRALEMVGVVQASQTAGNLLPGATLVPRYISIPTYRLRCHAEWDHHDDANMNRWGVNIVDGYRLANRQGIYQALRNLLLYGAQPANGEGILNTPEATAVTLPPDSFGDTTYPSYDAAQMALFLLQQIVNLKARTDQFGIPHRFVFLGPQRMLGQFSAANIVQLTSYQRPGAGSATTAEVVKEVGKGAEGDLIEFCYDDTLIGQGSGGTDMLVLIMPEVEQPTGPEWDTNVFARLEPNMAGTSLQYADMAAPMEITVPIGLGALDTLYELRASPGWVVRPECVTLISMTY